MPWKNLSECVNRNIDIVISQLIDQLNDLSPQQAATAKVVTSNQHAGNARGIIFYYDNPESGAESTEKTSVRSAASTQGSSWKSFSCKTVSDYDFLYEQTVGTLNEIAIDEAYMAKVSYSNYRTGDAVMVVFYQQD